MPNCSFELANTPDLRRFRDATFDLVFSYLVLQHLPGTALIESYVREFIRLLTPGGVAVFQLPASMVLAQRLQPRRRVYELLRAFGCDRRMLFRVGLQPIRMIAVSSKSIQDLVARSGGRMLAVDMQRWPFGARSATYFVAVNELACG